VGAHTVRFKAIAGWSTPTAQVLWVNANSNTAEAGEYSQPLAPTASLSGSISPPAAIAAGAQWQVDGGPFQDSDTSLDGLSVGSHLVTFKTVNGWTAPSAQLVFVSANQGGSAQGTYVPTLNNATGVVVTVVHAFQFSTNGVSPQA